MADTRALGRILKRITTINAKLAGFNDDTSHNEVAIYKGLFTEEYQEYRTFLASVKIEDSQDNIKQQDRIEDLAFATRQIILRLQNPQDPDNTKAQLANDSINDLLANQQSFLNEVNQLNKRKSEIRLPQIDIPTFSGKYSEFPSFRDLYEASIHNNPKLSTVHKFQYLKGLLREEAAALVRHLAVTSDNYNEAWDKIKIRYDKRKHVVNMLMKQFLEQPQIQHASAKSICHICDVSDEVLRVLREMQLKLEIRG